ncbi:MAG: cupin domain-containing protein [Phycisphaerae bacterium]
MIYRSEDATVREIDGCHDGNGVLHCNELFKSGDSDAPGFRFVHDSIVDPGVTIGEHTHTDDEEIYFIASGSGTMRIDGKDQPVAAGDICITRPGHSHSLENTGQVPMHLIVIGTNL